MIDFLNTKFSQSEQEEHVPIPTGNINPSGLGPSTRRVGRKLLLCLTPVLLASLILIYLFVISPAVAVYTKTMGMRESVGRLQVALDQKNLPSMDEQLRQVEVELSELKDLYRQLGYLEAIPFTRGYYGDGKHFLEAASSFVEGGTILLESINPFSGVLGLTEGFGRYLTAEQHVAKLAEVLPQIASQIDTALGKLFLIKAELSQINPEKYPEEVRGVKVRFWLEEAQRILSEFEPVLAESRAIIEILPHLLGVPERTYLVLFQNDAELRATGGFITALGFITVKEGRVANVEVHNVGFGTSRIPAERVNHPVPRYLRTPGLFFHDANYSPDFRVSAEKVLEFWRKGRGLPSVDFIVGINTGVGGKLLEFTGPIIIPGYDRDLAGRTDLPASCWGGGKAFTSENLVCRLEYFVEREGRGKGALLGKLAETLIEKLSLSPAEVWARVVELGLELFEERDLLFYSTDPKEQELIEKLDWAGRMKDCDGDYLHISDSNLGGRKTDMFMQETVEQSLVRLENGRWRKTVKINYYNPQRYDNWLSANYKDWVRIYVPKGSKLVSMEGVRDNHGSWEELGKTVFGGFFYLWPQKEHTLTFIYDLPSSFAKAMEETKTYKLLVQKQPGTNITLVKVKIGGKIKSFDLKMDREIEIEL